MKQALILDLDNTIYPVSSVSDYLFERFFILLNEGLTGENYPELIAAREALTKMPWHIVADEFNFSDELKIKGSRILTGLTCDLPLVPYDDYHPIRLMRLEKFLVTSGFTRLQQSKIKMLGIGADFKEIHIVDPQILIRTKRDVFADIIFRHQYRAADLLVIGDDAESEIKAARELGIETFLFSPENAHPGGAATYTSSSLKDVVALCAQ